MVERGGEERGKHKGHNYKNDSMLIWLTVANLYQTVFRAILVFFFIQSLNILHKIYICINRQAFLYIRLMLLFQWTVLIANWQTYFVKDNLKN